MTATKTTTKPAVFATTCDGETAILQALVNLGLTLRLYCNPHKPTRATTARDLRECTFPGYAGIRLAGSLWQVTAGNSKTPSSAAAPFQMFLRNAAGADDCDVHGWYLTTPDGKVVVAEQFEDAPWDVRRARDAVEVKPSLLFGAPQG